MKKRNFMVGSLIVLGVMLIIGCLVYQYLASPVDRQSQADIEVIIENGTSTSYIAKQLKEKRFIRSRFFFQVYVKLNGRTSLKAGTYLFRSNMTLDQITKIMVKGSVYDPNIVRLTFQEGKTVKDYMKLIAEETNLEYEQIINQMKDRSYLAKYIEKYWFLTNDILHSSIYYPLEGYLFPNTYEFRSKDVDLDEILTVLLDETNRQLSPYRDKITNRNPTIHTMITLASLVELEGLELESRSMIAGVFYNRLKQRMNLGSDVTTYYTFQEAMTKDLTSKQFNSENPYNTRGPKMEGKYPVGPICNPSLSSLKATLEPTENPYLYFVADNKGSIYYSKTEQEHLNQVAAIKERGDWIW